MKLFQIITCQSTCGSHSPARSTILRDVLVAGGTGVVHAIDVTPVIILWEIFGVHFLVWEGRNDVLK